MIRLIHPLFLLSYILNANTQLVWYFYFRSLTDTYGKSQGLQRCDLLQLKADGASGEQIVQNLVKNSTSFAEKTSYSQDKYLKRKQKKYLSYLKMHKYVLIFYGL